MARSKPRYDIHSYRDSIGEWCTDIGGRHENGGRTFYKTTHGATQEESETLARKWIAEEYQRDSK